MPLPKVILFIDDDADDRDLLCKATSLISHTIKRLTVSDGLEALKMLKEDAILPDMIFLDINMPIMNGMECLAELKQIQKLRHIPIIICSTSLYVGNKEQYEELGASYYLVKPDTLVKTANALQFVFESHRAKKLNSNTTKALAA